MSIPSAHEVQTKFNIVRNKAIDTALAKIVEFFAEKLKKDDAFGVNGVSIQVSYDQAEKILKGLTKTEMSKLQTNLNGLFNAQGWKSPIEVYQTTDIDDTFYTVKFTQNFPL